VITDCSTDRRASDRFLIERDLRYKVLTKKSGEESGAGRTINMSSTGILFTAEHMLLPGRRIEISVSWPAQLNNKCALRLVARGRVVRFDDGKTAMEIQQYEFRTQPAAAVASMQ
jgi:hypothetical protein